MVLISDVVVRFSEGCIRVVCVCDWQVVGLYRLCGSAVVKKELREAFERDSHAVELSENNYPDINVITGTAYQRYNTTWYIHTRLLRFTLDSNHFTSSLVWVY